MKTLYVEEFHQQIPPFLNKNSSGFVHSIFTNGLNIKMGDALFFIGTTKNGQLPFGIHLQQEAIKQLLENVQTLLAVKWSAASNCLIFANGSTISFEKGKSFTHVILPLDMNSSHVLENIRGFITTLVRYGVSTGTNVNIEQFMMDFFEEKLPKDETTKKLIQLVDIVFSQDNTSIEEVLRYFLGRGKGLTPSGDDHIVGLLALNSAANLLSEEYLKVLKKILLHESITTDIGREYLLHALRGNFSSSVTDVINHLNRPDNVSDLQQSMLSLLSVGHSSGIDTLFGILLGILSARRKYQLQSQNK
ncbi:DUF2877 domain-containing protein [Bacillus rubiinfantis]|uniref:DUF2877 domain-containing protein n=1 Tax=Bacillus rubiinfantis TaxID=1499680 RepID=UPI0005AA76DA|nr:DUF2877 domain-containing protein [Bacillus rubiinfantis]